MKSYQFTYQENVQGTQTSQHHPQRSYNEICNRATCILIFNASEKKATMKRKVANWISRIPQQYHTASVWSNSQNILSSFKNETEILIAASLQYNELEELDLAYSIEYCRRPSFPTHVVCNILFFLPSVLSPRYSISQCWNHVFNFVMKINN